MSMGDLFCKKMGENLRKIQESRCMSDDELSCILDITEDELIEYKNGSRRIDLDVIIKLEEAVYSSASSNIIDDLLDGIDEYSNIMRVSEPEKKVINNLRNMDSDKERWICGEVIGLICGKSKGGGDAWSSG